MIRGYRAAVTVLALLLSSACTLRNEDPPPLVGPSEFSTSISVGASPDVLATDGQSTALVTITVRDASGTALRGLSLRAETRLNGASVSLGTLSARSLLTDSAGRATLLYTAPLIYGEMDTGTVVDIAITPLGSNFANAVSRSVSIRLVPWGP